MKINFTKIKQAVFIDAAHRLYDSDDLTTKKCLNLHGHTYKIIVVGKLTIKESGLSIDFGKIKDIINKLDHQFINDIFEQDEDWKGQNTTAENIARYLYQKIKKEMLWIYLSVSVVEGYKGKEHSPIITYEG